MSAQEKKKAAQSCNAVTAPEDPMTAMEAFFHMFMPVGPNGNAGSLRNRKYPDEMQELQEASRHINRLHDLTTVLDHIATKPATEAIVRCGIYRISDVPMYFNGRVSRELQHLYGSQKRYVFVRFIAVAENHQRKGVFNSFLEMVRECLTEGGQQAYGGLVLEYPGENWCHHLLSKKDTEGNPLWQVVESLGKEYGSGNPVIVHHFAEVNVKGKDEPEAKSE